MTSFSFGVHQRLRMEKMAKSYRRRFPKYCTVVPAMRPLPKSRERPGDRSSKRRPIRNTKRHRRSTSAPHPCSLDRESSFLHSVKFDPSSLRSPKNDGDFSSPRGRKRTAKQAKHGTKSTSKRKLRRRRESPGGILSARETPGRDETLLGSFGERTPALSNEEI